jgi:hypothetical protein
MAEPNQMRREELLAARQTVVRELDQLGAVRVRHWASNAGSDFKEESVEKLQAILQEIDLELAESGSKPA